MATVEVVAKTKVIKLPLEALTFNSETQCRAAIDMARVAEYKELRLSGVEFKDPGVVFFDGNTYWGADGFHRYQAHKDAGDFEMVVCVYQGTKRDAILYAVGANATHGLNRTNADKRRAVETLLRDPEWSKWSDREIGKKAAVDHKTVGAIRAQLNPVGEIPHLTSEAPTVARKGSDGKLYPVKPRVEKPKPVGKVETPKSSAPEPPQSERRSVGLVGIPDEPDREDWEDDPELADARDDLKLSDVCREFKRTLLDCWAKCPASKRERFKRIVISEGGELK